METGRESMMDEALRILQEEGFTLPDDVKETLTSFSHAPGDEDESNLSTSGNRTTDYHSKTTKIRSSERPDTFDVNPESEYSASTRNASNEQNPPRHASQRAGNSDPGWGRNNRSRPENYATQNGTDTESSCSASTVREAQTHDSRQNSQTSYQERLSSIDSSVSGGTIRDSSKQADACSDKTMDDVLQSHEARTDNMKNMTRDMGNKLSANMRKGIGREISTDSGIADLVSSTQPGSPVSEASSYSIAECGLAPRSNAQTTAKRDSTSTYQDGKSQKTVKRDDHSIESTDVENASKGIFMTKAEQVSGNIDGVDTVESCQSSSAAMTATGTASKLRTEEKNGQLTTQADFEGDSRLGRQESSQSTIETDDAKLTKAEEANQEIQSKITESSHTTQGRRGSNTSVSTSKQENTKKESYNKSVNECKIAPDGSVSNVSKSEDSKSIAGSFSGKSSIQETKGGKTYTRSISKESSSESKTKNVSESKTYSSTSSDRTLTDGDQGDRPALVAGDNFTKTYDLGTEGLDGYGQYERRNSGASEISRQGSTASSIASSASAMYEREQQKKRQREAEALARNRTLDDHRGSIDSITKVKEVVNSKYNRNDSGPIYSQNRLANDLHQSNNRQRDRIYQNVPRSESAFSSISDDVFIEDRPVDRNRNMVGQQSKLRQQKYDRNSDDFRNRRATLQGDIVLTEREVFKTRDEIRANPRGRDDSFLSSHDESYYSSKDRIPGFNEKSCDKRFMDSDVIEREIISETLSEEDILFGNEDDFFGSSEDFFGRFKSKASKMDRRHVDDFFDHDSLFARKTKLRSANPYTTREDLSKVPSQERLNDKSSYRRVRDDSDAMSDSALRSSHDRRVLNKSRYGYSENEFDDSASVRSLPPKSDSRSGGTLENLNQRLNVKSGSANSYVQDYVNRSVPVPSYEQTMNRLHSNSSYPSLGVAAEESRSGYDFKSDSGLFSAANTSDSVFSAGKSIDRTAGRSMSQNNRNLNSSVKSFSDKNPINDNSNRSRRPIDNRCYDETDMHYDGSTRASTDVCHGYVSGDNRSRERGIPESVRGGVKPEDSRQSGRARGAENAEWEDRRQRIDKALSWIRAELGSLRTQDKVLTSQFQRCQDSIEQLKKQRPWYELFSDDEDDDDRHWEDWEIDEFDREYQRERRQRDTLYRRPEALVSEFERVTLQERDFA